MSGRFVVSLDFELYWGVRDKRSLAAYRENLLGVREAIPSILALFERFGIHATWATVGFLFFEGREELLASLPERLPRYRERDLSPYEVLNQLGEDEDRDPFHFAPSLVRRIHAAKGQEIGTHTFSHYYCLEQGQSIEDFRADLEAARSVAKRKLGIELRSIVFPRNQFNPAYLKACAEIGLRAHRGNLEHWLFEARRGDDESRVRRGARLLDSYLPLSGSNASRALRDAQSGMIDVPASRFLRPHSRRLERFDDLRLARIVRDMRSAAERGELYHLWWHPHNFGVRTKENLRFLEALLEAFADLRRRFGFESLSMGELAEDTLAGSA